MKANEKYIAGGAVVLLLVFAGIIAYSISQKSGSTVPSVGPSSDQAIQSSMDGIIASGNAAECSSVNAVIGGVNYETVCENNIAWNAAQKDLDVNDCHRLDNQLMSIADCQNQVIASLINKVGNISVCDQLPTSLNMTCENEYWFITAAKDNKPALCANLTSSSTPEQMNCQYNVILSEVSMGKGINDCSVFSGAVKNDCVDYEKDSCAAITFFPLAQVCERNTTK